MVRKSDKIVRRNVLKKIGASSIGVGAIAGSANANESDGNNTNSDDKLEPQAESEIDEIYLYEPYVKVVDEYYTGDDIVEVNITAEIKGDERLREGGSQSALTFFWEESSWTLHDAPGYEPLYHCNNYFEEEIGWWYELDGDEIVNPDGETNHGNDPGDFDRFSAVWENEEQTYNCTSGWACNYEDSSFAAYKSLVWGRIYLLNQNSNNSPADINVEIAYLPTTSVDAGGDISICGGSPVNICYDFGGWFGSSEVTKTERMYCCDEDGERIS